MSLGSTAVRPASGQSRFGIGFAAATWFVTLLVGYAITLIVFSLAGEAGTPSAELPPWATLASVLSLWGPQLLGLWYLSDRYGTGSFREDFSLRFRLVDLVGVPIGVLSQLVLLELVYWPLRSLLPDTFGEQLVEQPAQNLFDRATGGWLLAIVIVVVVGAPIVEELMYRGLIHRSIDGRITAGLAVMASATWFALAHVQGIQLPGLLVFGVVLALCLQRTGRLGMSMLAHSAFNATTVVLLLWHDLEGTLVRAA